MLELGTGWYSTPLLHEVAMIQERTLFSHDNDRAWLAPMANIFRSDRHFFETLNRATWMYRQWGLVFVDHGPTPETPRNDKGLLNALDRAQAVLDLMDRTDVFVLHDTEQPVRWEYDWDKVLPLFKYHITDASHDVHTTICSNKIDVTKW